MSKYRNVFIIGAQSTGKTTLVTALQTYFTDHHPVLQQPTIIREVARDVLSDYNLTRDDILASPATAINIQLLIMHAQLIAERSAIAGPSSWFISDRSGIDPIAYAHIHAGEEEACKLFTRSDWQEMKGNMQRGLVFVCEAGGDHLVDDGVRVMPKNAEEWSSIDTVFRTLLTRQGINFIVVPTSLLEMRDRVGMVMQAITAEASQGAG